MKYALIVIAFMATIFLIMPALGLFNLSFWGPKFAEATRNVYEQSAPYVRGTQRDMENLVLAYKTEKDPEAKAAILSTLRHRAYGVPANQVPADVLTLINQPQQ